MSKFNFTSWGLEKKWNLLHFKLNADLDHRSKLVKFCDGCRKDFKTRWSSEFSFTLKTLVSSAAVILAEVKRNWLVHVGEFINRSIYTWNSKPKDCASFKVSNVNKYYGPGLVMVYQWQTYQTCTSNGHYITGICQTVLLLVCYRNYRHHYHYFSRLLVIMNYFYSL